MIILGNCNLFRPHTSVVSSSLARLLSQSRPAATEVRPCWYKEPGSLVQRTGLAGTEDWPRWYKGLGKLYPRQLSNVSLTAVKRLFVSCQMYLCQLSKVCVKIFVTTLFSRISGRSAQNYKKIVRPVRLKSPEGATRLQTGVNPPVSRHKTKALKGR